MGKKNGKKHKISRRRLLGGFAAAAALPKIATADKIAAERGISAEESEKLNSSDFESTSMSSSESELSSESSSESVAFSSHGRGSWGSASYSNRR